MLSYLHGFHAGNHADVLKHAVLTLVLEYMQRKDKPFLYVDTHAGSGLYGLQARRASANQEHDNGIARLWPRLAEAPEGLRRYLQVVQALNPDGHLGRYPGSPWIARMLLRPQDRARLYELHPQEFEQLRARFADLRTVQCEPVDGFQALRAILPPAQRRGVVLIDPPYEVKSDYARAVHAIVEGHRRFATGVNLLWYPVLTRKQVAQLENDLLRSGIPRILQVELTIRATTQHAGMTGSGMLVVNPPWQLEETLQGVLPFLQQSLADADGGYRLQWLAGE